jgi:hypothetical protein
VRCYGFENQQIGVGKPCAMFIKAWILEIQDSKAKAIFRTPL